MNLGTAYVGVRADRKKLKPDLDKAEAQVKKSAGNMSSTLNAISFAAVAAGATAFAATVMAGMAKAIDAASDLQEVTGKFEVVFADQIDMANKITGELVDGYATSTREARQYLSSIQDLLVPMGVQADLAANLSGEVVKLAADLGSFNNLETAQVMDDIQSALVGNYETMKKYGVVLNATVVQQKALNAGLAGTKEELTAAHKAQAAYNLIVESSQAALGDMARTSDSYANQQKQLNANIEEFKAILGGPLMDALTPIVKQTNEWAKANKEIITEDITNGLEMMASALQIIGENLDIIVFAATWAGKGLAQVFHLDIINNVRKLTSAIKEYRDVQTGAGFFKPGDNIYKYGEFGAAKMPPPAGGDGNGVGGEPSPYTFTPGVNDAHVDAYREFQAIQQQIISDAKNAEINPLTFSNMSTEDQLGYQSEMTALEEYINWVKAIEYEAALERFSIAGWLTDKFVSEEGRKNKLIGKMQRMAAKDAWKNAGAALAMMGQQNKAAFEWHKKYKIAEATVSGIDSAVKAWNAGMSTGGPWAPVVAAAYTAASLARTGALISSIQSTQFEGGGGQSGSGGGGGGVSVGAYPSDVSSSSASMTGQASSETAKKGDTIIHINSPLNDRETADYVIGIINDAAEERDVTIKYADRSGGV